MWPDQQNRQLPRLKILTLLLHLRNYNKKFLANLFPVMQQIKIKYGSRFIHKLFFYPFSTRHQDIAFFGCCLFISLITTIALPLVYLSIILNQNGTIDPIKSLMNHSHSQCLQKYDSNSMCLYVQNLTFAFGRLPALPKTGHSREMGAHNPHSHLLYPPAFRVLNLTVSVILLFHI